MAQYILRSSGIAVLKIKNPPVNGLSKAVRDGIVDGLRQAKKDGAKCVVIGGSGSTFPAGADIKEFSSGKFRDHPDLVQVLKEMDACDIPLVAAIHGTALGGGLETALACDKRICDKKAMVGLPEVFLGIFPGAGGTQRLPRLVGKPKALDIITSGKPLRAPVAAELGIVDLVLENDATTNGDFADQVAEWAEANPVSKRRVSGLPSPKESDTWNLEAILSKTPKNPVNLASIAKAIDASSLDFSSGMDKEQDLFNEICNHPHARSLQHLFFAERIKTIKDPPPMPIKKVGVIGGGTMGRGIAMCFMNRGIPVTLVETNQDYATATIQAIRDTYQRSRSYNAEDCERKMSLLTTSLSMNDLSESDAIIEAVFENLELKRSIFKQLGAIAKPNALLCTNTSVLNIDHIAEASGRPEQVIGTHFFSPAHVMQLLENVRGAASSPQTISTAMNMGKILGKKPILAGNCFGFIGNRMLEPYAQQAVCLIEEGASPSTVDNAMTALGFAMGPLAVWDLAGNDVPYRIRREPNYPYGADLPGRQSWRKLADTLVESKRLGQKSNKGWYDYPKPRVKVHSAELDEILFKHRKECGIQARTNISSDEIQERCLFPLVNEGFRILKEKHAESPADIDVVWTSGYGFPRYLGGPMFHATNTVGLDYVRSSLLKFGAKDCGPKWHFDPSF